MIKILIRAIAYPVLVWKVGLFPMLAATAAVSEGAAKHHSSEYAAGGGWIVVYGFFFTAVTMSVALGVIFAVEYVMRGGKATASESRMDPKTTPADADAFQERARVYIAIGNIEAAIGDLTRGMRVAPERAQVFLKLRHDAYLQLGQLEEALSDITEANRL